MMFLRPWILLLLLLIPLAWRRLRWDSSAWDKVVDPHLRDFMLAKEGRRRWPFALAFAFFFFGILAAAALFYVIPVVILFAISQKTLLNVQQGGLKQ